MVHRAPVSRTGPSRWVGLFAMAVVIVLLAVLATLAAVALGVLALTAALSWWVTGS